MRNPNITPVFDELSYPQKRALIDCYRFGSISFGMRGSHEPGKEPRAVAAALKRLQSWGLVEPIGHHQYKLTERGENMVRSQGVTI